MQPTTLSPATDATIDAKVGKIELPGKTALARAYIKTVALASWAALAEAQFTPGARVAMTAVAQVAGIAKGHNPRTTLRLLADADLSTVPNRLSINLQKDLKANRDKLLAGKIMQETHDERAKQLGERYAEAGAYWATFNVDQLIDHVKKIAANMNILGFTLVGKVAKGAQVQYTLDEALQNVFGFSVTLKDAWQSIKLGLAAQQF